MKFSIGFDRELERWLEAEAPSIGPADLHGAVIERARNSRQRPAWLVALRGGTIGSPARIIGRPALGIALVVIAVSLVVVAALVAGAFRPRPANPLGRNGVVAFSVFENKQRAGQTSWIHWLAADGTLEARRVAGTCPAFSSDGTVLVSRTQWAGGELQVAAADGSSVRTLPFEGDYQYRDLSYALSPDGTRVAYFKRIGDISFPDPGGGGTMPGPRNELWVAPVAGGAGIRLVQASSTLTESYWLPTWSPDSREIAFEGFVHSPGGPSHRSGVYVVEASGADVRVLTSRPLASGAGVGLAWSPNGRSLAYLGLPDGVPLPTASGGEPPERDLAADVFLVGADGTSDRNLTSSPEFESRPAWSPDGTQLAYLVSDTTEAHRVARAQLDGLLVVGAPRIGPEATSFAWSPDGTTLLLVDSTTIRSVDRAFRNAPTILVDLEAWPQLDPLHVAGYGTDNEHCAPAWQRLEP